MRMIILLLLTSLTGCTDQEIRAALSGKKTAGQTFRQIHSTCEKTIPFAQLGQCLQFGLDNQVPDWRNDIHAGYVATYISWLDAAGARVLKNELSEQDMKFGANELLGRFRTQVQQNRQAATANSLGLFLAGFAILNSGAGNTYTPPPSQTTYSFPGSRPITCTTMAGGSYVSCF